MWPFHVLATGQDPVPDAAPARTRLSTAMRAVRRLSRSRRLPQPHPRTRRHRKEDHRPDCLSSCTWIAVAKRIWRKHGFNPAPRRPWRRGRPPPIRQSWPCGCSGIGLNASAGLGVALTPVLRNTPRGTLVVKGIQSRRFIDVPSGDVFALREGDLHGLRAACGAGAGRRAERAAVSVPARTGRDDPRVASAARTRLSAPPCIASAVRGEYIPPGVG